MKETQFEKLPKQPMSKILLFAMNIKLRFRDQDEVFRSTFEC